MTPQELKNGILQLAIQGKLVEQRAEEGNGAQVLLSNQKETIKLPTAVQKNKVGKTCSPIKEDELPFEIPATWTFERFGRLVINCDSQRKPVTKSDRKTTNALYDYYGATGAIDKVDEFIFDGEYLMIGEDGGNFFVSRDNSFIATGKFWANNHVHVVQTIYCDIQYLKICLDACNFPKMGLIHGIAVPKLNQECLNSILIPIPPLAEQKRIVAKIEELLPLIGRYEQAWSKLEDFNKRFPTDMQKAILQMAIEGKLVEQRPEEGTGEDLYREIQAEKQKLIKAGKIKKDKPLPEITDDEKPFDIPESWKWVHICDVIDVRDGTHDTPKYVSNGIPLVTSKNLVDGKIDFDTAKPISREDADAINMRSAVDDNDILFAMIGTIGNPVLVTKDREFCIKNMALFKNLKQDLLDMEYLYFFLMKEQSEMKKIASASVQSFVSLSILRNYFMPLPPLAEQERIVEKLNQLLPLCERLK